MSLARHEAVVLALYSLGGRETPVHTEDVAVRVAKVAPGMFSWKKYEDRIDKELVRVALSDARLKKSWVEGSHDGGWLLTPVGQRFAREKEDELGGLTDSSAETRRAGDPRFKRERARLVMSEAHQKVLNDGNAESVTEAEIDAFFRINVYADSGARAMKVIRIENLFGDDPELEKTVKLLASKAKGAE